MCVNMLFKLSSALSIGIARFQIKYTFRFQRHEVSLVIFENKLPNASESTVPKNLKLEKIELMLFF